MSTDPGTGAGAGTPPATPATGGAAPAVTTPNPTAGSAPAASTNDWTSGLNDDLKGYVQNKGFKAPTELLESYINLEKLRGIPAEKLLRVPDNFDDQKVMGEIYNKLGRPGTPNDYKIAVGKDATPEDKALAEFMQGTFFETGLSTKQAHNFLAKWNDFMTKNQSEKEKSVTNQLAEQETNLKKEWGMAYDNKISAAKRAAREFGVEPTTIDALEKMMGFDKVMKLFDTIGSKLGEGSFHTGNGGGNMMTPAAAIARIKALRGDPAFGQKLTNGDATAKAEWDSLHKMAYPEGQ